MSPSGESDDEEMDEVEARDVRNYYSCEAAAVRSCQSHAQRAVIDVDAVMYRHDCRSRRPLADHNMQGRWSHGGKRQGAGRSTRDVLRRSSAVVTRHRDMFAYNVSQDIHSALTRAPTADERRGSSGRAAASEHVRAPHV